MNENLLLNENWYYQIEVDKGVFTSGNRHGNLALTRKLLRNISLEGAHCLDIGTQEAVIPILLMKNGAGKVVAYDRLNKSEKIDFLKTKYDVEFDYISGIQLNDLPKALDEKGDRFFDVVVFSGVLYHMINPMGLLALVRGLCRLKGLFLIETAAVNSPEPQLLFNAGANLYTASSNYFVPTTGWLDYVLRMLGLRPLEAAYIERKDNIKTQRVAILCRSEEDACPLDSDDSWIFQPYHKQIFADESQVDWSGLMKKTSQDRYCPAGNGTIELSKDSLYKNIKKNKPYRIEKDKMVLTLEAEL